MSWLVFDLHGSVVAMCPSTGSTITDAYRFDGFGQQIDASGSATNPWRYRGLLNIGGGALADALLDMGARDYSPQLGQFTQQDSVQGSAANPMTMNRFLYALANPATLIDPDGHKPCLDEGGACSGYHWDVSKPTGQGKFGPLAKPPKAPKAPPNGVAPIDEGFFTGYAPWDLADDEDLSDTYGNAVANCIGHNFDDPACQVAHGIDDWKAENQRLYCSFHRAECDVADSVRLHLTLGGAGVVPGLDVVPTALDAALYVIEGDLAEAGISLVTLVPGADAIRLLRSSDRVAKVVRKGDVAVYISVHGDKYVGITNDLRRRGAQHWPEKGIRIRPLDGLENLTRLEARSVEQVLIREFGGPGARNVLNKINSIAESRGQFYADAIVRGCALLLAAGHQAPNTCG